MKNARLQKTALPLMLAVSTAALAARTPTPPPPHPVTDPIAANSCANCPGRIALGGSAGAEFMAAWQLGTEIRAFRRLFDADGNGSMEVAVPEANRTAFLAGVASDGAGGWTVGWFEQGSHVFVQPLDADENRLGPPIEVNGDHPPGADDDSGSVVGANGRQWVVVARTTPELDPDPVVAFGLDTEGNRVAGPVELGTSFNRSAPRACVRPDGGVVAAWNLLAGPPAQDDPVGVALGAAKANGTRLMTPVVLLPAVTLPPTNLAGFALAGYDVGCTADNGFAAFWQSDRKPAKASWDIAWRRFTSAGRARGAAKLLNVSTAGDQLRPSAMVRGNGNLLVVWESREDGASFIKGIRLAANGKAIGGELVLHQAADGELATFPQLADLPGTGRFVLGWTEASRQWLQIFGD